VSFLQQDPFTVFDRQIVKHGRFGKGFLSRSVRQQPGAHHAPSYGCALPIN
jgi:hypothetical protein